MADAPKPPPGAIPVVRTRPATETEQVASDEWPGRDPGQELFPEKPEFHGWSHLGHAGLFLALSGADLRGIAVADSSLFVGSG